MKELYSDNLEKVEGAIGELWQGDQNYKSTLSKQWELNVNYYNGLQNINFASVMRSSDGQIIVPRSDPEGNLYISNEIGPAGRAIVSFLTRSKPSVEVFGVEDSEGSKLRAYMAEKIHEAKYDLDNEQAKSIAAAEWGFCTGTAVRKDWWDYSYGKEGEVIDYDDFGNEIIDPETGRAKTRKIGAGKNRASILPPFAIAVDPYFTSPDDISWIVEGYMAPIDWVRSSFDQDLPGYYPDNAKSVKESSSGSDTVNRVEDLKTSVSMSQSPYLSRLPSRGKTLVLEAYMEPSKTYPRGRMIVVAGGKVVYSSTPEDGSPYYMPVEPLMWHPYSFFIYEPYVGRLWGKSAVEQVLPLQMRINEINGAILRNANTMAQPYILAAENQLSRGTVRGGGARIVTFKPRPDSPPPMIVNGAPLPAQFFQEGKDLVDRIVRILGTNFVMQGQAPSGVSAAAAISQLLENANTQQSPIIQNFESFHTDGFTKKLRLIRKYNYIPMKDLNDYLRNLVQGSLRVDREVFSREDLSDGIGIKVVSGSMMAKSDIVRRNTYLEFAKEGLLGPIAEDSPRGTKLRSQLFDLLGEKPLKSEDSIEVQKAEWENNQVSQNYPIEVGEFDIHAMHIPCHLTKFQDPHFIETASEEEKAALHQHIKQHEQAEEQKQIEMMAKQQDLQGGAMPPPPPQDMNAQQMVPPDAPMEASAGI